MNEKNERNQKTAPPQKTDGRTKNKTVDPELELFLERKCVRKGPFRWLLIGGGFTALGLGILGIPLPLLPTTPFLLLAAGCFGRSSEPLLRWLLTNRLFGDYLRNYVQNRGIPRRVKIYILALLWTTIGVSVFFAADGWWLRLLLITVAIGVTIHVLRIRTAKIQN